MYYETWEPSDCTIFRVRRTKYNFVSVSTFLISIELNRINGRPSTNENEHVYPLLWIVEQKKNVMCARHWMQCYLKWVWRLFETQRVSWQLCMRSVVCHHSRNALTVSLVLVVRPARRVGTDRRIGKSHAFQTVVGEYFVIRRVRRVSFIRPSFSPFLSSVDFFQWPRLFVWMNWYWCVIHVAWVALLLWHWNHCGIDMKSTVPLSHSNSMHFRRVEKKPTEHERSDS